MRGISGSLGFGPKFETPEESDGSEGSSGGCKDLPGGSGGSSGGLYGFPNDPGGFGGGFEGGFGGGFVGSPERPGR